MARYTFKTYRAGTYRKYTPGGSYGADVVIFRDGVQVDQVTGIQAFGTGDTDQKKAARIARERIGDLKQIDSLRRRNPRDYATYYVYESTQKGGQWHKVGSWTATSAAGAIRKYKADARASGDSPKPWAKFKAVKGVRNSANPTEWPRTYRTKKEAESDWYDSLPGVNDRVTYVKRRDGWHIIEGRTWNPKRNPAPGLTEQQKLVKASQRKFCDRCNRGMKSGTAVLMKGGPGRLGYSAICGACMQEGGGGRKALNPAGLYDVIRPGSRVTIVDRFGVNQSGRAVMLGPAGWVLNMGGRHGTPAIATPDNIIRVSGGRSTGSLAERRLVGNPAKQVVSFNSPAAARRYAASHGLKVAKLERVSRNRKVRLTKEQAKALKDYNFALAQEDRYLGSVFVTPTGQRAVEAKTAQAYDRCKRLGMTHEHGL